MGTSTLKLNTDRQYESRQKSASSEPERWTGWGSKPPSSIPPSRTNSGKSTFEFESQQKSALSNKKFTSSESEPWTEFGSTSRSSISPSRRNMGTSTLKLNTDRHSRNNLSGSNSHPYNHSTNQDSTLYSRNRHTGDLHVPLINDCAFSDRLWRNKRECDGRRFHNHTRRPLHIPSPTIFSCHNRHTINSVNRIKPQRKVGAHYAGNTHKRTTQYSDKKIYTRMNERDVISVVKGFLYMWRHLRPDNASRIKNFIISRNFRIHQDHANLFLNMYCPKIVVEVKGINYRFFLDLIVKCVVDYQDGKLIKREYTPGKYSLWNDSRLYCQYLNPIGTTIDPSYNIDNLLPEEVRFRNKHPSYHFHQYEIAVKEYNYFTKTNSYCREKSVDKVNTADDVNENNFDDNDEIVLDEEEVEDVEDDAKADVSIHSEHVVDEEDVEDVEDDAKADVSIDSEHRTDNEDDHSSLSSVNKNRNIILDSTRYSRNSNNNINVDRKSNNKREAPVTSEERPIKQAKTAEKSSPNKVDINDLPPFPTMDLDFQEQYTIINCEGTYHHITMKDSAYDVIPEKLYQRAIVGTYEKFCKFCSDEFDHWLLCQDDEDGELRDFILSEHGEHYKSHDFDTWWLDIPDQKESIIKFLQVLCVNSVWSLGYRCSINVTKAEFSNAHYLPCWCPCNKRFKHYYDHMKNGFLSYNNCLECTSSKKPYRKPQDFKAHLHDTDDWVHKLLLIFVTELYELKCLPYQEGHIMPVPDHKYDMEQKSVLSINVSSHKTKG